MASANDWQPTYADLHIHIGRTSRGEAVKISGSRDLTFENIAREASGRKGIRLLGVIDCHAPVVQLDIEQLLEKGTMTELAGEALGTGIRRFCWGRNWSCGNRTGVSSICWLISGTWPR